MNLKYFQFVFALFLFFFINNIIAQSQKDDFKPYYITVTKLHGSGTIDMDAWKKVEQEFFDKITSKIDLIKGHEVLVNYDNNHFSEVIFINRFESWNDIEKTKKLILERIENVWPDKDLRASFFENQNNLYDFNYSNAIYVSTEMAKYISKEDINKQKTPLYYYIITSKLSSYSGDDSLEAYRDYVKGITYKNPYIKAYLTQKQYFGSDSRNFVEVYVANSYEELQESFKKDKELLDRMFSNEKNKEAFIDTYFKGIDRQENAIYTNIPSMSK
ncbi:MAG: hypothetical protein ABFR05_13020 [Bacteroidota bacterium]